MSSRVLSLKSLRILKSLGNNFWIGGPGNDNVHEYTRGMSKVPYLESVFNPFHISDFFLYPLKTSENLNFHNSYNFQLVLEIINFKQVSFTLTFGIPFDKKNYPHNLYLTRSTLKSYLKQFFYHIFVSKICS